jgi:hypothetical protein
LGDNSEPEIKEFIKNEKAEGHIVAWENRELVWAERCEHHEREFILANPDYNPCPYCRNECKSLEAVVCGKYQPIPRPVRS